MVLEQHLTIGMTQHLSVVNSLAQEAFQYLDNQSLQALSHRSEEMFQHPNHWASYPDPSSWVEHKGYGRVETASIIQSDDCTLSADPTDTISGLGRVEQQYRFVNQPSWKSHPLGHLRPIVQARPAKHNLVGNFTGFQGFTQTHNFARQQHMPTASNRVGPGPSWKAQVPGGLDSQNREAALRRLREMQHEIDSIKSEYQAQSDTRRSQDSLAPESIYQEGSPGSRDKELGGLEGNGFHKLNRNHEHKQPDHDSNDQDEDAYYQNHLNTQHHQGTLAPQMNGHTFQHISAVDHPAMSSKDILEIEQEEATNFLPEIPESGINTEQGSPTNASPNLTHTVWPETKSYFIVVKKMFNKQIINEVQKGLLRDLILGEDDALKLILRQYEQNGDEKQFYSQILAYLDTVATQSRD